MIYSRNVPDDVPLLLYKARYTAREIAAEALHASAKAEQAIAQAVRTTLEGDRGVGDAAAHWSAAHVRLRDAQRAAEAAADAAESHADLVKRLDAKHSGKHRRPAGAPLARVGHLTRPRPPASAGGGGGGGGTTTHTEAGSLHTISGRRGPATCSDCGAVIANNDCECG